MKASVISIKMDRDTLDALDVCAMRREEDRGTIVRRALDFAFLDLMDPPTPAEIRKVRATRANRARKRGGK